MYIEIERHESYCNIRSTGSGNLVFLNKKNQPLSNYPAELTTMECPLKSPLVVQLELTRRCKLNCKHCYISAGKPRRNELLARDWKSILNQLKELEVLSVYFTGGDPLLSKDCVEIFTYAQGIGLSCNLLTNGLELEKNLNVDDIPKEIFLVLSFDGAKGTSILRHIPGKRILNIINILREKGRAFAIQGLLFKDNTREMLHALEWCAKAGIDFSLNNILPIGRAKKNRHLLLSENQFSELTEIEKAKKLYSKCQDAQMPVYSVANPNIYQSISDIVMSTRRPEPGIFVAYVSSDGFLYADNYYAAENWESKYNLRYTRFSDAWTRAFKDERRLSINTLTKCAKCFLLEIGGHCDFQNMAMRSQTYKTSGHCGVYN